jgi:hypothetical protein
VRPRIESIGTLLGEPLESIDIPDRNNFDETVRVLIGPEDGHGEEIFDVHIASPQWIEGECIRKGYWSSQKTIVIADWTVEKVRAAVQGCVFKVSGDSWQSIAQQLAGFMFWEFQDYKELRDR